MILWMYKTATACCYFMQNKKTFRQSNVRIYTEIIQEPIHFKLGDKTSLCIYNKYVDDHIIYLLKKKPLHSEQNVAPCPTYSKIQVILI